RTGQVQFDARKDPKIGTPLSDRDIFVFSSTDHALDHRDIDCLKNWDLVGDKVVPVDARDADGAVQARWGLVHPWRRISWPAVSADRFRDQCTEDVHGKELTEIPVVTVGTGTHCEGILHPDPGYCNSEIRCGHRPLPMPRIPDRDDRPPDKPFFYLHDRNSLE